MRSITYILCSLLLSLFKAHAASILPIGSDSSLFYITNNLSKGVMGLGASILNQNWGISSGDIFSVVLPKTVTSSVLAVTACDLVYQGVLVPSQTVASGDTILVKVLTSNIPTLPIIPAALKNLVQLSCPNTFPGAPGSASALSSLSNTVLSALTKSGQTLMNIFSPITTSPSSSKVETALNNATRVIKHSVGVAGTTGTMSWTISDISSGFPSGTSFDQVLPVGWEIAFDAVCTLNDLGLTAIIIDTAAGKIIRLIIPDSISIPDLPIEASDIIVPIIKIACHGITLPLDLSSLSGLLKQVINVPGIGSLTSAFTDVLPDLFDVFAIGGSSGGSNVLTLGTDTTSTAAKLSLFLGSTSITIPSGTIFEIIIPGSGVVSPGNNIACHLTSPLLTNEIDLFNEFSNIDGQTVITTTVPELGLTDTIPGTDLTIYCDNVVSSRFVHTAISGVEVTMTTGSNKLGLGTDLTLTAIPNALKFNTDNKLYMTNALMGSLTNIYMSIVLNNFSFNIGDFLELSLPQESWEFNTQNSLTLGPTMCKLYGNYDANSFDVSNVSGLSEISSSTSKLTSTSVGFTLAKATMSNGLIVGCTVTTNPFSSVFSTITSLPGGLLSATDDKARSILSNPIKLIFDSLSSNIVAIFSSSATTLASRSGDVTSLAISSLTSSTSSTSMTTMSGDPVSTPVNLVKGSVVRVALNTAYKFRNSSSCTISHKSDTTFPITATSTLVGTTANPNIYGTIELIVSLATNTNMNILNMAIQCTELQLPPHTLSATSDSQVSVFNTAGDLLARSYVHLPSVEPNVLGATSIYSSASIPGQITTLTVKIAKLTNELPQGGAFEMNFGSLFVATASSEPTCLMQVSNSVVSGDTNVVTRESQKTSLIINYNPLKKVAQSTSITIVCSNLRIAQDATVEELQSINSIPVQTMNPDHAIMDVAVGSFSFQGQGADFLTEYPAAIMHSLALSTPNIMTTAQLRIVEQLYQSVLNATEVRVSVFRQYLTYTRDLVYDYSSTSTFSPIYAAFATNSDPTIYSLVVKTRVAATKLGTPYNALYAALKDHTFIDNLSSSLRSKLGTSIEVVMGQELFDWGAYKYCMDGMVSSGESDRDCGGNVCAQCADRSTCSIDSDCFSNYCTSNKCASLQTNEANVSGATSAVMIVSLIAGLATLWPRKREIQE